MSYDKRRMEKIRKKITPARKLDFFPGLGRLLTMNIPGSRSLLRLTSRLLLAVLLLVQFALAAEDCTGQRNMERALQRVSITPAMEEGAKPCHHQGMAMSPEAPAQSGMSANLCVAHCTAGDQSSDTPQVSIFAAPLLPVLSVALPLISAASVPARALEIPHQAAPPPIPILFGIFRS